MPAIENMIVFAAAAILAAWTAHMFVRRAKHRRADGVPAEGTPLAGLGVSARLRDFYRLAVLMEEEGAAMYQRLAALSPDPAVQRLASELAAEEAAHRARFQEQLGRWRTMPPHHAEWPAFVEAARRAGLFPEFPPEGAAEREIARLAIEFERRTAAYYSGFEESFPDAWRRGKMAALAAEERMHEARLKAAYPGL